ANDYKGKILMILVNDPPATSDEPNLFGGRALTYYGRWTYKYEEAARKGAAGVILVHTDESAGYGWNVVRTSNGNWRYEVARGKKDKSPFLKMKAWAVNDVSARILKQANLNLEELKQKATKRDFQPVKTGLKINLNLESETKTFDSPNVVAKVNGTDAKLKDEYVAWTAHWDHLGIGESNKDGDKVYNGAYDNASGVSSVMAIAEALNRKPTKRSHIFVFTTAEEQGLIGAEYYAQNPLVPLNKTIANLNLDGTNIFGKTSDFMALGAERSSLMSYVKTVADERNMTLNSDQRPEQGFFFRSDHFPFAKAGVPCISFQHGSKFIEKLSPIAESFQKEYNAKHYHQPSDQFGDWMDFSAMVQQCEYSLAIGVNVANTDVIPRYNDNDEFSIADKARFVK
ncbi:MAG: M28 family peptidase, partial [Pyrinomonadaceae bacterium]|nr:M28 family peptidase [Pyrinomonadaceae bacterium]